MGIFDSEIKRACTECPRLLVKAVNSIFSREYDENAIVEYLDGEQPKERASNFMDLLISIEGDKYHIEFQLLEGNMAVRMYEYSARETIKQVSSLDTKDKYVIDVIMPQQAVIFLSGDNKKNEITVNLTLPDKNRVTYTLPCISAAASVDELCKQGLYIFVPFQQVQMNKRFSNLSYASDDAKIRLGRELRSYREIVLGRLESLKDDGILKANEYDNLIECFRNVERYLLAKDEQVEREANMGDDVKPWSEQLREQGREEGIEEGIEQGIEQGVKQGIAQGIEQGIEQSLTAVVLRMHAKGKSLEDIMIATELSEEDIHRIIENNK